MVGAGGDLFNTKKLIYDVGKLGAELEAVVREGATWTPPKGNVPMDKDVGRAFSCKTAKAVGEKQNIGGTPGRDRQWPKNPRLPQCPVPEEGESR